MSADIVIPPHIAGIREDYFAVVLADSPRALEIVDEALAKHFGWTLDDLSTDDHTDLGGES